MWPALCGDGLSGLWGPTARATPWRLYKGGAFSPPRHEGRFRPQDCAIQERRFRPQARGATAPEKMQRLKGHAAFRRSASDPFAHWTWASRHRTASASIASHSFVGDPSSLLSAPKT